MLAGIGIILLAVAVFVGFASMDQAAKLRMPVWQDFVVVVGGLVLVIIGGVVSAWFTWKSLGVLVYRFSDGLLYYEFWSPKYYEYLKVKAPDKIIFVGALASGFWYEFYHVFKTGRTRFL